jgi:hypothetical protein
MLRAERTAQGKLADYLRGELDAAILKVNKEFGLDLGGVGWQLLRSCLRECGNRKAIAWRTFRVLHLTFNNDNYVGFGAAGAGGDRARGSGGFFC